MGPDTGVIQWNHYCRLYSAAPANHVNTLILVFYPLDVVSHCRDPQQQVDENTIFILLRLNDISPPDLTVFMCL